MLGSYGFLGNLLVGLSYYGCVIVCVVAAVLAWCFDFLVGFLGLVSGFWFSGLWVVMLVWGWLLWLWGILGVGVVALCGFCC